MNELGFINDDLIIIIHIPILRIQFLHPTIYKVPIYYKVYLPKYHFNLQLDISSESFWNQNSVLSPTEWKELGQKKKEFFYYLFLHLL